MTVVGQPAPGPGGEAEHHLQWQREGPGPGDRDHDSRQSRPGPAGPGRDSRALGRAGRSRCEMGQPGCLTTWSKEKGKRQSEFGMEMQSHEVSGGNAESPDVSNARPLMQSTPAQGDIVDPHGSEGRFPAPAAPYEPNQGQHHPRRRMMLIG